jgi:type II secretory pathway pseudopilin PulG
MTLTEVVVALAIVGLILASTVIGYINCAKASVKTELEQAANAKAMERLEATHCAIWAPLRATPVDQLVASNFPDLVVSLDQPGTNLTGTVATIKTTIASISTNPPMRSVHVDCIWQFQGQEWMTNSVETILVSQQ